MTRKVKIYCPECGETTECVRLPYTKVHKVGGDDFVSSPTLGQMINDKDTLTEKRNVFQCAFGHRIPLPEGKGWRINEISRVIEFYNANECPECGAGDEHQANVRRNEYLCLKCQHKYIKD